MRVDRAVARDAIVKKERRGAKGEREGGRFRTKNSELTKAGEELTKTSAKSEEGCFMIKNRFFRARAAATVIFL